MHRVCLLLVAAVCCAVLAGCAQPPAQTPTPSLAVVPTLPPATRAVVSPQPSPSGSQSPAAEDLARVGASGKLLVGSALDNPPFEMYNDQFWADGFDVALMTAVAGKLGLNVEFKDFSFEGLVGALQLGQVDAVISSLAVTKERAARVDFTRSYYRGEDAILVAPGSPIAEVKTAADVGGRRIGVLRGSVYESFIMLNLVETGQMARADLQSYGRMEDGVRDLNTGRIDLVIMDRLPALAYVSRNEARVVGHSVYVQDYAVAVRKGSTLLPDLNRALAQLEADGTVTRLAEKYLQLPADQVEPVATAVPEPSALPPTEGPTSVPTPVPTITQATPTPEPVDGMGYVADLTLDDRNMAQPPLAQPGQALQKGWRVKNSGTTTWSPDYRLEYAGGNTPVSSMGGQTLLVGRAVAPGQSADLYLNLVAPQAPGIYQGFWQIKNAAGVPFGEKVYVGIAVPAPPTPVPPPTQTPAPGIAFWADRDHIRAGECANLNWNVSGVQAVYFCPQDGSCRGVTGQGGQKVCPGATSGYELRVEKSNSQVESRRITVNVAAAANAPAITTFSADRGTVRSGECLNLWWKVQGETSRIALVRDDTPLWDYAAADHSFTDCPTGSGLVTYEVQAWGPNGSGPAKRQLSVTIEAAPPPPQTVQLDESGCGSTLNLRAGDTLIVTLQGAGGTGYQWEQSEANPSVLTPLGPVTVVQGEGMGAPVTYTWAYRAGSGKTNLVLVWHRPSEGNAPPADQCSITVTVQ